MVLAGSAAGSGGGLGSCFRNNFLASIFAVKNFSNLKSCPLDEDETTCSIKDVEIE